MAIRNYDDATFSVRQDLAPAHDRFFEQLAQPGNWWNGSERVAIAREIRQAKDCRRCATRKKALSPYGQDGEHDAATALPPNVIDAIHRITTDPGRLTRQWYESVIDDRFTPERYVEMLGILVALVSIDSFCIAIGVPLRELPEPYSGDPDHYRPRTAVVDQNAWVPMIPADGNVGAEADLWQKGRTGHVIQAMSLIPNAVRTLFDLMAVHYLPIDRASDMTQRMDNLDRPQMELIAGRISALNQCYY